MQLCHLIAIARATCVVPAQRRCPSPEHELEEHNAARAAHLAQVSLRVGEEKVGRRMGHVLDQVDVDGAREREEELEHVVVVVVLEVLEHLDEEPRLTEEPRRPARERVEEHLVGRKEEVGEGVEIAVGDQHVLVERAKLLLQVAQPKHRLAVAHHHEDEALAQVVLEVGDDGDHVAVGLRVRARQHRQEVQVGGPAWVHRWPPQQHDSDLLGLQRGRGPPGGGGRGEQAH